MILEPVPARRASWRLACVFAALAVLTAAGCGFGDGDDGRDGEASGSGDGEDVRAVEELRIAIEADTSEVAKEEAALDEKREEIEAELADLEAARERFLASGGKGKGIDTELIELLRREKALREKELSYLKGRDSVSERKTKLIAKAADGLVAPASAGGGAGDRTTDLAGREKKMAGREGDLASREKKLAEREAALALREAKGCGAGASIVTRIEVPAGKTYTKKHVDAAYGKAKARMRKKGILLSDLPAGADTLPEQIEAAIEKKDWAIATVAAENLASLVNGVRIDRAFVQAKIARLNTLMKRKKITPEKNAEVWGLFTSATRDFSDGKFAKANVRINSIYTAIK